MKINPPLMAVDYTLNELRARLPALREQRENPSVASSYNRLVGKIDALEAVKRLLETGSYFELRLL